MPHGNPNQMARGRLANEVLFMKGISQRSATPSADASSTSDAVAARTVAASAASLLEASGGAVMAKWKALIAKYQERNLWRASWQIVNSVGSYVAMWVLLYWSLSVSWWLTIPLAVLAAGLLVRVFIIFHDCGHGSYFASRRANDFWGFVTGFLTITPFHHWRGDHAIHHGATGDLDRRGVGDIWTMTVQEYLEASRWKRFAYRLARNPIVLFVIAPLVMFLLLQRLPRAGANRKERLSVWWTNVAILITAVGLSLLFGLGPYLLIHLTILLVSGSAGIWLFYMQHQFEHAYWERGENWDYATAALKGSSFLKLPRILQWFSGNIGFHHIHHLSPRIPNYNLEQCHRSDPSFQEVTPITLFGTLKAMGLRLWDESSKKLVSFRQFRQLQRQRTNGSS